ncbi:MAG TPA: ferredoxin reductase [Acidimicrobiia bacterium]|nr:ferredoxin reductase [Acidimicrobiia bacterium]
MEGTALRGRLTWLIAEVVDVYDETPRAKSIVLRCPEWPGHLPGQHVDIRLTAEDGYQAQRSYSIATPEDHEDITLTVELVTNGEVSQFLLEDLRPDDRIEIRGPIGGYFVWEPSHGGPLQLIGGGSGVVPLMAMLRAGAGSEVSIRYLGSARTFEDILYREELEQIASSELIEITHTLTRSSPPGWAGPTRRVDRKMIEQLVWPAGDLPTCFICGPTGFVETVAEHLVDLGHATERVKTERFGPSGG